MVRLVSLARFHRGLARAAAGAPLELTDDLLTTFNIARVVRGTITETGASGAALAERRYAAARARSIFQCACRCHSHQGCCKPYSAPGLLLPCKRSWRGEHFLRVYINTSRCAALLHARCTLLPLLLDWRYVCHRLLPSPSDMTTATIIHRIVHNRAQYEARNAKKSKSEAAYYSTQKTFVQEG